MKTVIFSGTTEGRRLSEMLSESGIDHHVCVATAYGSDVMADSSFAKVRVGRMDEKEMTCRLASDGFGEGDIIVDATHPYATEVSGNIRKTAVTLGCELINVIRRSSDNEQLRANSYVNRYADIEEFSRAIEKTEGNILLTTGSKELSVYCNGVSFATLARTYVRVIPAQESLGICVDAGIEKSHIIAMQGPFSYEMNAAVMKQYDIRHMLTKDSGHEGGFDEKVKAAEDLGVTVHVIARPDEQAVSSGVSLHEAFERIAGRKYHPKRRIVLAGAGMGAGSVMTLEVVDAIRNADAVFGASSVVDAALAAVYGGTFCPKRYDMYMAKDIIAVLSEEVNITRPIILFSGDTGFYSGAKEAYRQLSDWDKDADISVLPGISSVSYMASRLCESYDDAVIMSVHGRNSLHNMESLVDMIDHNAKVFALVSGAEDIRSIAKMLKERNVCATVHIGRNMSNKATGHNDCESMEELSVDEAVKYSGEGKITALFINDKR